jgi:uncharacterized protein YhfF
MIVLVNKDGNSKARPSADSIIKSVIDGKKNPDKQGEVTDKRTYGEIKQSMANMRPISNRQSTDNENLISNKNKFSEIMKFLHIGNKDGKLVFSKNYFLNLAIGILVDVVIWIFVFLIFLALLIFAASKTPKKTFLGYSLYAIADECLEPMYSNGDCVIIGVIDAAEIDVGDFITFTDDDNYAAGIVDSTLSNYKNVNAKFFRVKDAYNNTYVVEPKYITGREICKLSGWGYIVSMLGSKTLYE